MEQRLVGISASPGIVLGPVHLLRWEVPEVPQRIVADEDIDAEIARFHATLDRARDRLRYVRNRAESHAGPEEAAIFVDGSPVFETLQGFSGRILARYQDSGSPLLSGYLIGEKYLHGKAAAVDVQLDRGHVVLFGFRPQWRGQPFGTLKVIFNAAMYGRSPSSVEGTGR